MSAFIVGSVLRYSKAEHAARLVLIVLADHAHQDGVAWPSQEAICQEARLSKSAVKLAVAELVQSGEVEVQQTQRGRKRFNVYRVLVADVADVDYDRIPGKLKELFTLGPVSGPSHADQGQNLNGLGPESGPALCTEPSEEEPSSKREPVLLPAASGAGEHTTFNPVKTKLIEGRNLPFDALVDECHLNPESPRLGDVAVALNGRKGRPELGIRTMFLNEMVTVADSRAGPDGVGKLNHALVTEPETFERMLATAVGFKAAKYRTRMPEGTMLTPTALAKWWLDLEKMKTERGLTAEEMMRL